MIAIDTSSFRAFIKDARERANAAARPAAQAGAQVIYDQAKANAPVSDEGHYFYGKSFKKTGQRYYFESGSLRNAIYQAFQEKKSRPGFATYAIAWNRDKAPYGHMVELGTSRAPAHPFLGPALHQKAAEALAAMRAEFFQQMR